MGIFSWQTKWVRLALALLLIQTVLPLLSCVQTSSSGNRVRHEQIQQMTDQQELFKIATTDTTARWRAKATDRISDQDMLVAILEKEQDLRVRKSAVGNLTRQNTLEDLALNDNNVEIRLRAIEKLTNQKLVKEFLFHPRYARYARVRRAATFALNDQNTLKDIANNDRSESVRLAAFHNITSQEILASLATTGRYRKIRVKALAKINSDDQEFFTSLATGDHHPAIQAAALARITDLEKVASIAENNSATVVIIAGEKTISNHVKMLTDEDVLADYVRNSKLSGVRLTALEKISRTDLLLEFSKPSSGYRKVLIKQTDNQPVLAELFSQPIDNDEAQLFEFLPKLNDPTYLKQLAKDAKSKDVRNYCKVRLATLGPQLLTQYGETHFTISIRRDYRSYEKGNSCMEESRSITHRNADDAPLHSYENTNECLGAELFPAGVDRLLRYATFPWQEVAKDLDVSL